MENSSSRKRRKSLATKEDVKAGNQYGECEVLICCQLCVKCVSLDTGSIPPEINPWAPVPSAPTLPSLSSHHAYSSVRVWACVPMCVLVFTLDGGLRALCRSTCRGATEKDSCVFERNRKHKKERVEGQQACQSRPSLWE